MNAFIPTVAVSVYETEPRRTHHAVQTTLILGNFKGYWFLHVPHNLVLNCMWPILHPDPGWGYKSTQSSLEDRNQCHLAQGWLRTAVQMRSNQVLEGPYSLLAPTIQPLGTHSRQVTSATFQVSFGCFPHPNRAVSPHLLYVSSLRHKCPRGGEATPEFAGIQHELLRRPGYKEWPCFKQRCLFVLKRAPALASISSAFTSVSKVELWEVVPVASKYTLKVTISALVLHPKDNRVE